MNMRPTPERIRSLIEYNPETGLIRWKAPTRNMRHGWSNGGKSVRDYWRIQIDGQKYLVHVIAFIIMTGRWPRSGHDVDHIDRKQDNNVWTNLREATESQNAKNRSINCNNSTGAHGVTIYRAKNRIRYRAQIRVDKRHISLGLYDSIKDAARARRQAELQYFGEFAP